MTSENKTAVAVNPDKLDFKRVLPIFVIVLIDLLGVTIILPLLPLYATTFGVTPFVFGLLSATYPLMQFIGAPILGRLSDQYGRKPILMVSQFGTLVGFLLLAFAGSVWMLFLSRVIDGISGANIATAQAAIADSTTEKTRTQGLGLIGAAFGLGFIIGPVIAFAALAVSQNDYRLPALIAAAFSLLSILLTAVWFRETLPREKRGARTESSFSFSNLFRALARPAIGLLLIFSFSQQLAFSGLENFFSLFTLNWLGFNAAFNSVLFVYIGVILVAVQGGFVGKWSRRFGDRKLVFAGLGLMAIGMTLVALTPSVPPPWYNQAELTQELTNVSKTTTLPITLPPDTANGWLGIVWLLVALVPVSIGAGILSATLGSLISKRVTPAEVGGMLGINTSMLSAANVIAPLLGGLLFQFGGATWIFWFGAVLLGFLFMLATRTLKPGIEDQVPQPA